MAGGASLETGVQKQRELRILEAVYPRPSSIPERFVQMVLPVYSVFLFFQVRMVLKGGLSVGVEEIIRP